jgi:hypothetical protein
MFTILRERFPLRIKNYFVSVLYDMIRRSSDKYGKNSAGITFSNYSSSLLIWWAG